MAKLTFVQTQSEKNYFGFILKSLRLFGINIIQIKNRYYAFLYNIYAFIFLTFTVYYYVVAEFIDIIQHRDDIDHVTFNLCYFVTQFTGLLKGTLLLFNKNSIRSYCKQLESDLFLPNFERGGRKEYELVKRAIKICNIQAIVFYALVIIIVANRTIYAAISHDSYEEFNATSNLSSMHPIHVLPYNIYLPFDTDEYYTGAFIFQVVTCGLLGLYIGACDALITGLMVHLKAQICILQHSFENILDRAIALYYKKNGDSKQVHINPNDIVKVPKEIQKYVSEIVRDIIKHHQEIILLMENAENEFNLVVLSQFLGSLLLMCMQLFQLSLYDINSLKFFSMISYLFLMLFQLLIYCWNGNELTIESMNVAHAAFNSNWLLFDNDTQKALMLVIQRAQRPLRMSAGKFAFLSLETFMNILQGSGSYYLALRRINE